MTNASGPGAGEAVGEAGAQAPVRPRAAGRTHHWELWLSVVIVIVDQVTKALVRASLPVHGDISVIPGFLSLTHVLNTGAAFGILNTADFPWKGALIALVASAALIGIAAYTARLSAHQRTARLGLALILGGAAGNLVDRFVSGAVLDFVDVYWGTYHFWAFNVADAAITTGVCVMILDMLWLGSDAPKAA
jgi:signal peptidase II